VFRNDVTASLQSSVYYVQPVLHARLRVYAAKAMIIATVHVRNKVHMMLIMNE
jgi:hypothetical protein